MDVKANAVAMKENKQNILDKYCESLLENEEPIKFDVSYSSELIKGEILKNPAHMLSLDRGAFTRIYEDADVFLVEKAMIIT